MSVDHLRPPDASAGPRGLAVLGSTGSIGTQTLEIVRLFPEAFRVRALTAGQNAELLIRQAREFRPDCVVIGAAEPYETVREALRGTGIRVCQGTEGLCEAATWPGVDVVMAAIVGAAGLPPVLEAIAAGKLIALANKETLVIAGALVRQHLDRHQGRLIPVDSEHSAILQCLAGEPIDSVEALVLTASGGPFRTRPKGTFDRITKEEALQHPNWSMGAKITIDSATMMNKGLEVIEAHWLFGIPPDRLRVLVHPQSIIHSLVTFRDGSTKAQLGVPDMKVPIQYALSYPDRWPAPHERIDWATLRCLDFEQADPDKFPCLPLAFDALARGGTAPAVLNAANEAAVALFLDDRIRFVDIPTLIEEAVDTLSEAVAQPSLETLIKSDEQARYYVRQRGPELRRATAY